MLQIVWNKELDVLVCGLEHDDDTIWHGSAEEPRSFLARVTEVV